MALGWITVVSMAEAWYLLISWVLGQAGAVALLVLQVSLGEYTHSPVFIKGAVDSIKSPAVAQLPRHSSELSRSDHLHAEVTSAQQEQGGLASLLALLGKMLRDWAAGRGEDNVRGYLDGNACCSFS